MSKRKNRKSWVASRACLKVVYESKGGTSAVLLNSPDLVEFSKPTLPLSAQSRLQLRLDYRLIFVVHSSLLFSRKHSQVILNTLHAKGQVEIDKRNRFRPYFKAAQRVNTALGSPEVGN